MCPLMLLCNWNWIFCYLGQKPPNWWWRTVKMAVVPHRPLHNSMACAKCNSASPSIEWISLPLEHGLVIALNVWKVQSLILRRGFTQLVSHLMESCCHHIKKPRLAYAGGKTVERNSLFPASYWAIKPSRPDQHMSWSQKHSGFNK